nr:putative disease resistance protein At1g50180 [Coffea arabica]
MQDILMQLCPEKEEEIKNIEDRELVRELYRVQTEYKCLITLDDIWYMHDWENLVHAFPDVEGGSKMMLTTRTKEVAEIGYPYEIKCLNEEESWELLKATISSRKYVKGCLSTYIVKARKGSVVVLMWLHFIRWGVVFVHHVVLACFHWEGASDCYFSSPLLWKKKYSFCFLSDRPR